MIKIPKSNHKYGYTRKEVLDIIRPLKIHHKIFWKKFGVNKRKNKIKSKPFSVPIKEVWRTCYIS